MKQIIEFNMPDDKEELILMQNAWKYKSSLIDFSNQLRQWRKHTNKKSIKLDELADIFYKILNDNDCEIHD